MIDGWYISFKIALIWMSLDFTDDQSTLVQVMSWCHQAPSHYLSQSSPRSLSPYGVTWPQWVDVSLQSFAQAMTAQLSPHGKNLVAITFESKMKFSSNLHFSFIYLTKSSVKRVHSLCYFPFPNHTIYSHNNISTINHISMFLYKRDATPFPVQQSPNIIQSHRILCTAFQ